MSEKEVRFEENGIVHVLTVDEAGNPVKKKDAPVAKKSSLKWWKYLLIFAFVVYPKLALLSLLNIKSSFGLIDWIEIGVTIEVVYLVSESTKINKWLKLILYPLIIIGFWILSFVLSFILYLLLKAF